MSIDDKRHRESEHETEAGDAGKARNVADQAPRQDRDRYEDFDINEVKKTRADRPPPLTPPD